ncbi:MAG: universal stress protein [Acidobacteria bacterium]|nr:universal stress protein [Acidobacteriota bacterium]
MKILLAVDGSSYSDAAVAAIAKRPWPAHSEIKILSVIEPFMPYMTEIWATSNEFWEELEKAAQEQANQALQDAVEKLTATTSKSLQLSTEIVQGNPKNAILDEAEKWGADLIVLGSHGYTGFKRLLLGSVSQAVASHAHCSVEIVRLPEAA